MCMENAKTGHSFRRGGVVRNCPSSCSRRVSSLVYMKLLVLDTILTLTADTYIRLHGHVNDIYMRGSCGQP